MLGNGTILTFSTFLTSITMFDDQIKNNSASTPPGNLPIGEPAFVSDGLRRGEPEDMFVDTEKSAGQTSVGVASEPTVQSPASALGAGILRPKQLEAPPAVDYGAGSTASQPPDVYKIKEPALTRGLITIVIVLVVVAILGGGGWWIYSSFIKTDSSLNLGAEVEAPLIETEEAVVAPSEEEPLITVGGGETTIEESAATSAAVDVIDDQILFGEPVDKDGDSLDDLKEKELGTDPANWDTDNDELGDGDEILIWQTDPLNPDSDGDSYLDGAEVKNGYNPKGAGKIFEVPSE